MSSLAFACKTEEGEEEDGLGSAVIEGPAEMYRQLRMEFMQGLESIGKSLPSLNPSLRPLTLLVQTVISWSRCKHCSASSTCCTRNWCRSIVRACVYVLSVLLLRASADVMLFEQRTSKRTLTMMGMNSGPAALALCDINIPGDEEYLVAAGPSPPVSTASPRDRDRDRDQEPVQGGRKRWALNACCTKAHSTSSSSPQQSRRIEEEPASSSDEILKMRDRDEEAIKQAEARIR
jgi:hypothetical protein